ncbi:TetR/AcrR family transcriptional regulator [Phenylobacterium sp.]|uniref:TetR/AcrR family transcriptional regulator n=1 Tax=Phenylobacterium sp. TaxID=1871053 RepID=UPI00122526BF|nr:TetR/AcrR family transcriptional regulator [Phenylobacterium sp.]THD57835.1 MAG: TetR/AcrR family transcriptional regulator [Phenylobacterium sp.]
MARRADQADGETTAAKLCAAAMAEFNAHGFAGTDTNRIARRAGFAPQTFYRWYKDKTEIFIAAYRAWEEAEKAAVERLMAEDAPVEALVDVAIAHHRQHLGFRRSLRQLSLENPQVRAARAQTRLRQVEWIRNWYGRGEVADIATQLFELERLADAVAEGEFADMGLDDAEGLAELVRIVSGLRTGETA